MFKIGDRVKCIDIKQSHGTARIPLVLNREYIVYGLRECKHCGGQKLDVGYTIQHSDTTKYTLCTTCNNREKACAGEIWWFKSSRFIKVEESYRVIEVSESILEQAKQLITPETIAQ